VVLGVTHTLSQQIHFLILMSRQGKVRLAKWYTTYNQKERARVIKEITPLVLARPLKLCNFLDWKNIKLVYKRYASLYFLCGVDASDNELITLEIIHHFVEVLDRYFGNVCELDLIFNFHKAYYILDELLIAGKWNALQLQTRIYQHRPCIARRTARTQQEGYQQGD
jgi:AP-1 complex subunit sigma 1/2